jgi:protein gp37
MKDSKIQWTTHTFNPWVGCAKVSTGCTNCYAEAQNVRWGKSRLWGVNGDRDVTSKSYWRQPLAWNADAEEAGERARVFCASMADVFEDRPDLVAPRLELFKLIALTPWLDWLLLTKRPENIARLTPAPPLGLADILGRWSNVWNGTTVEDQAAVRRMHQLLEVRSAVRFLSVEPMLGPVVLDLRPKGPSGSKQSGIDWVICGGESGAKARDFEVGWAHQLKAECDAAAVPFFMKQLGSKPVLEVHPGGLSRLKLADKKGGTWEQWPSAAESLKVRAFPQVQR